MNPNATPAEVSIRPARASDAYGILKASRNIIRESPHNITTPEEYTFTVHDEEEWISGFIKDPNALLLVAETKDEIIGTLNFKGNFRKRMRHTGEMGIGIIQGWRGQGIGTRLIQELQQWASAHPVIQKITLNVFAGNTPARTLYRKLGFIEEGCLHHALLLENGQYEDLVLMACWVRKG